MWRKYERRRNYLVGYVQPIFAYPALVLDCVVGVKCGRHIARNCGHALDYNQLKSLIETYIEIVDLVDIFKKNYKCSFVLYVQAYSQIVINFQKFMIISKVQITALNVCNLYNNFHKLIKNIVF